MRPGQQPMQYCSSFEGAILSLIKLFFYYLVVTLLDQQSFFQASIECGNKTLLALLPTASISHNRDNRPSEQSAKCNIGQALVIFMINYLVLLQHNKTSLWLKYFFIFLF